MPQIYVVEPESRHVERIRDALATEAGWSVVAFDRADLALQAAAGSAPDLVLVNVEVEGAETLLATFAKSRGGRGVLALLPERRGAEAEAFRGRADAVLVKPFAEQEMRLAARRVLAGGNAEALDSTGHKLTSAEIFGDLLAEFRDTPQSRSRSVGASDAEIHRKLEETLSGVLGPPRKPAPAPPTTAPAAVPPSAPPRKPRPDLDVDSLLSKLDLDLGRVRSTPRPAAKLEQPPLAPPAELPAPAAPKATPPPAPTPQPPVSVRVAPEGATTQRMPVMDLPAAGAQGREFGQYALLEKIAIGGMAEVWKARMKGVEGFQKTVAIKKILPHLTDNSAFVSMFIDEAKLAAQLAHPNITHIYDLGKIGNDYYIAMEFVEGRNLRALLNATRRQGVRFPLGLALLIGARLASALDYAHRKKGFDGHELGLVHRDVSPQNVLISNEGDIKLCDFGIVKAVSKASHTQMGALKGKLQYMSPEQAWGRQVDGRSDLFSLGAILFEMLTGRRLFPGENEISVLEAVRECRIESPKALVPTTPDEVDALVRKALAREPADRFQTAGTMQQALEGVLHDLKPTQADLAAFVQRLASGPGLPDSDSGFGLGSAPGLGDKAAAPPWAAPEEMRPAPALAEPPPPALAPPALAVEPPRPKPSGSAPRPMPRPEPAAAPARVTHHNVAPHKAEVLAVAPPAGSEVELEEGGSRGRTGLIAAIAATLLLGALGAWVFLGRGKTAEPAPADTQAPAAAVAESGEPTAGAPAQGEGSQGESAAGTEAAVSPPAGEAVPPANLDVAKLVDRELAKREQDLRRKLDAEQEKLEQRLADTKAGEDQRKATEAPKEPAGPTTSAPPAAAPTPEPEPVPRSSEVEPAPAELTEPERVAPASPPPSPPPAAAPETTQVERGQLVKMGPGVVPPSLVSFVKPEYPAVARRLRVEGTVEAELLVDENGAVREARLSQPLRQDVGINEAALAAVRGAKFRPATKDGVPVKIWTKIKIPFKL